MGKGGTPKAPKPGPMEVEQARQLKEYYEGFSKPGVAQVGPQVLSGFAANDLFSKEPDPYARDTMERQFGQAKNQLLNDAPVRGGRLARAMSQQATDRAMGVSGLYADKGKEARGNLVNMLPALFPNAAANQSTASGIANAQNSRNMAAWQQGQQNQASMGQGVGGLLGSLLAPLGKMFLSSILFKDSVEPFTDDVLKMVADTPVYNWRYVGEERAHIGPITEEAPSIIVSEDGMALVPIDYLGFMFAAIKALEARTHVAI